MLKSPTTKRQPFAIIMLIMVLWQCLFVAVEAGEQFHIPAEQDSHHLATNHHSPVSDLPCANAPCHSHSNLDFADEHGAASDSCDHCCACHGHGAHVSIHIQTFSLVVAPLGIHPVADLQVFYALRPTSIYRPPIA